MDFAKLEMDFLKACEDGDMNEVSRIRVYVYQNTHVWDLQELKENSAFLSGLYARGSDTAKKAGHIDMSLALKSYRLLVK